MTRTELIESLEQTFKQGVDLVRLKNQDYATDSDPFKNFDMSELVGVSPTRALLVRVADKLARLSNIMGREAVVKDETVQDTILDIINYMGILRAMIQEGENNKPKVPAAAIINVNGYNIPWSEKFISYNELIGLVKFAPGIYSIVVRYPNEAKIITLLPEQSISIINGMRFTVMSTNTA